ncbi:MAG: hypothetical protein ACJ75J_05390 [Cytophagaceae bacterium]
MNYSRIIVSALLVFLLTNCGPETRNESAEITPVIESSTPTSVSDLKSGGLYLLKSQDSTYHLTKILVIDDYAVHVRTYSTKFTKKPLKINSDSLDILIGHAPIDKEGFLSGHPELIKVEEVKDSELEGYKIYLEAMKELN